MNRLPKCRLLWIMGMLLIALGAFVHSRAETWSERPYPLSVDAAQKSGYIDFGIEHLYVDLAMAMIALGVVAFTLGLTAWVYPARSEGA